MTPARRTLVRVALGLLAAALVPAVLLLGCHKPMPEPVGNDARLAATEGQVKVTPESDPVPPVLHIDGWKQPVPVPGPLNTAGAEDSPYVAPDASEIYFFFTPDLTVPVQEQLLDGVTGVYVSRKVDGAWNPPERLFLSRDPSMDGCIVLLGDTMWFASVRSGNYGEIDVYTARREDDRWGDWRNAGRRLNVDYDIGEFHLMPDGKTLYFHADSPGGYGDYDMWVTHLAQDGWSQPENLGPGVNTVDREGWPFVTPDGTELWFTGCDRAGEPGNTIWRSLRNAEGEWGKAELVLSGFAGEPCLDDDGNIYFIHHLFWNGVLTEADVYVAERR